MMTPLSDAIKASSEFTKKYQKSGTGMGFHEHVQHCGISIGPEALLENNFMKP